MVGSSPARPVSAGTVTDVGIAAQNPLQANHLSYQAYNDGSYTGRRFRDRLPRLPPAHDGRKFRNHTLGQVFRQFWRRFTWKEKAGLIFMAWLFLAFVYDRLFRTANRRVPPVPASSLSGVAVCLESSEKVT